MLTNDSEDEADEAGFPIPELRPVVTVPLKLPAPPRPAPRPVAVRVAPPPPSTPMPEGLASPLPPRSIANIVSPAMAAAAAAAVGLAWPPQVVPAMHMVHGVPPRPAMLAAMLPPAPRPSPTPSPPPSQ